MSVPDFTGERFIPGQGGAQIAYEHLHRYYLALRWAAGKLVLDVAAGTGYGAALLAGVARRVWAIDIDAGSVRHAHRSCTAANLDFLQGDAVCLPVRSRSVGLVVAFEVLEHVEKQEALVAEMARVVLPDGAVLISTPNKASYSDARQYQNPFHVHEFYRDEFLALLGRHFSSIRLLEQQVRAGSLVLTRPPAGAETEIIARPVDDALPSDPMYFLALCSPGELRETLPAASAFLDVGDGLLREGEQRLAAVEKERQEAVEIRDQTIRELQREMAAEIAARDDLVRQLQEEVEGRTRWVQELESEIHARDETVRGLQEVHARWAREHEAVVNGLQAEVHSRDEVIRHLQREFEDRTRWAQDLAGEVAARDDRLRRTNQELDRVAAHLAEIRHARLYRILCRLGMLPR
jgi:SAM-dependent methyltransferase